MNKQTLGEDCLTLSTIDNICTTFFITKGPSPTPPEPEATSAEPEQTISEPVQISSEPAQISSEQEQTSSEQEKTSSEQEQASSEQARASLESPKPASSPEPPKPTNLPEPDNMEEAGNQRNEQWLSLHVDCRPSESHRCACCHVHLSHVVHQQYTFPSSAHCDWKAQLVAHDCTPCLKSQCGPTASHCDWIL